MMFDLWPVYSGEQFRPSGHNGSWMSPCQQIMIQELHCRVLECLVKCLDVAIFIKRTKEKTRDQLGMLIP